MNILGIETSCDETAAAVVQNGTTVRSSVVSSSLSEHTRYGGIIPEIASRRQIELINFVVKKALVSAKCTFKAVDAIAVTSNPGLIGSLLVGISFARALSYAIRKPLVEVNHIHAHLYANFLNAHSGRKTSHRSKSPKLPAIGLVASGGHTNLFYVKNFSSFHLLGQTRDDAAGEAFDKVARLLDLGYPGGPAIDRLAREGKNNEIHFPHANLPGTSDFSFSGIKTAVLYHVRKYPDKKTLPTKKIAYAFQESVVSSLVNKCVDVCKQKRAKTLITGGGVIANSALRKRLADKCAQEDISVSFPPLPLCMDNAVMIAGLGYHSLRKPKRK